MKVIRKINQKTMLLQLLTFEIVAVLMGWILNIDIRVVFTECLSAVTITVIYFFY